MKSYATFINIRYDVGFLHIFQISHVFVMSMEAILFTPRRKFKWIYVKIISVHNEYND